MVVGMTVAERWVCGGNDGDGSRGGVMGDDNDDDNDDNTHF